MSTFRVSPHGRGDFRSISAALAAAVKTAGADEIVVKGGTYAALTVAANNVTISFEGGAKIDADGARNGVMVLGQHVTLDGLDVFGADGAGITTGRNSHHVSVLNSKVHDNDGHGISFNHGYAYTASRNEVFDNYGSKGGPDTVATSGISVAHLKAPADRGDGPAFDVKLVWNHVHDNGNAGSTDANGIILDELERFGYDRAVLVANNLIEHNGGTGFFAHDTGEARIAARDNVLWHNGQDLAKARAVEIAINQAPHVKLLRNVAEAEDFRYAFSSTGPDQNSIQSRNNTLSVEGHSGDDRIVSPWTGVKQIVPTHSTDHLGVDAAEAFPWWFEPGPNWDL